MRKKIAPFLIVLLSFVLVCIWFRDGYTLASGESGIPFYPLGRDYEISINTWKQTSLGSVTSISLVGLPFHFATYQLISIGIPPHILQMVFFFGLIASSALCMFFLVRLLFNDGNKPDVVAFLSSLFYVCNFIAINSVWHRLQYPFIFFYALLPITLYFLIVGIQRRRMVHVLTLTIVSFVFSMAFASLPMVELFWFVVGLCVVFQILISWRDKKIVWFAIKFFFFLLVAWVLTNSWWLLQFLEIFTSTTHITTKAYTTSDNVGTLNAISERLGDLSYIFRLMHKDYLIKMEEVWGYIFYNPIFFLLSFIIPLLVFFPLLIKKKPAYVFYFLGMSLLLLFLTKGTADPFGYVFLSLFERFRFLEAFRNPFEKFGLALPMFYAPIVGFSLVWCYEYLVKTRNKLFALITMLVASVLIFVALVFPMWNGWVFMGASSPSREFDVGYKVEVPQYYEEANEWINNNNNPDRIVILPISNEGVKYNWRHGYNGGEISNTLFSNPAISYSTATEFQESIAQQLEPTLFQNASTFNLLASMLNVGYVVIRNDVDYNELRISDPSVVLSVLDRLHQSNPELFESKRMIGKLSIYKFLNSKSKFYVQNKITVANQSQNLRSIYSISNDKTQLILNYEENGKELIFPGIKMQGVFYIPDLVLNSTILQEPKIDQAVLELPFVRFLPDSVFYRPIRLKENAEMQSLKGDVERYHFYLDLSSKRMAEIYKAFSASNFVVLRTALQEYLKSIADFEGFNRNIGYSLNKKFSTDVIVIRKLLGQRVILRSINSGSNKELEGQIVLARNSLNRLLERLQVDQKYQRINIAEDSQDQQRLIYTFELKNSGDYEVYLKNNNSLGDFFDLFLGSSQYQLNNKIVDFNRDDSQQWNNLGRHVLPQGVVEIQVPIPASKELLDFSSSKDKGAVRAVNDPSRYSLDIKDFDPYGAYRITLDYWLEKGESPKMQIITSEQLESRDGKPVFNIKLDHDNYDNGWRKASITIQPTKRYLGPVKLSFLVEPFNDCKDRNSGQRLLMYKCERDLSFKEGFNRETVFHFKNLKMERIFDSEIVLRSVPKDQDDLSTDHLPEISYSEINPTHYKVSVKNALKPFMLVFSESFHTKWSLYSDEGKKNEHHYLANSYANAWYVDKNGSYEMDIRFEPERTYYLGMIISLITIVVMVIVFIKRKFR